MFCSTLGAAHRTALNALPRNLAVTVSEAIKAKSLVRKGLIFAGAPGAIRKNFKLFLERRLRLSKWKRFWMKSRPDAFGSV